MPGSKDEVGVRWPRTETGGSGATPDLLREDEKSSPCTRTHPGVDIDLAQLGQGPSHELPTETGGHARSCKGTGVKCHGRPCFPKINTLK